MKPSAPGFRRFGPGTVATCVGVIAFAAYGFLNRPSSPQRTYFEADPQGRLRQVARPSTQAGPAPRLFKPEPDYLLSNAEALLLSASQRRTIAELDAQWKALKAHLERRMSEEAETARRDAKSVQTIQSSLAGYAELSREYAMRREAAYAQAVDTLRAEQADKLRGLEGEATR